MSGVLALIASAASSSAGISIVSSATTANTSNGASLVITKPSGIVNGDVLISVAHHSTASSTWTPGTGFTEVQDFASQSAGDVARRTVDGTEAATFTLTCSSATGTLTGGIVAFRNAIFDQVGTIGGAASPSVAPGITMTGPGIVLAVFSRNASGITFSTPSGFTPLWSDSDGSAPSIAVFWKAVAAGATGDVSTVPSAATASGYLIGIKST